MVIFQHGDEKKSVSAPEILQALGRQPHSGPLELEAAGIEAEPSGQIVCNEFQQSSRPHIFAAGDVCSPHEIVHIAIDQGEKAAENAAVFLGKKEGSMAAMDYRLKLLGIFTDPQVAHRRPDGRRGKSSRNRDSLGFLPI